MKNYSTDELILLFDATRMFLAEEEEEEASVVVSLKDITERKKAEDALRRSEEALNEAQRLAKIGSWDWDATTDTITWSEEYYHIYGFDPTQRPPGYEGHLKAYTPESAARIDAAVRRSMQTGEPYELDLEFANPKWPCRWITARSVTKRDAQGKIIGLCGTAQDITERKQAEEVLHQSEELYRTVVDNIADAIVINVGTKRVFVNNAYLALHGLHDVSQTLELPLGHFILPEDTQFVHEQILARQRGHPVPGISQYRICRPDGEVRTVEALAVPITYKTQPAALAVLRDITERKQAEDALRIKDWAIESSIDGIGIADIEGHLTYVNQSFLKMWGYDEKEVLGKHILKFCQREDEVVEAIKDEGWIGEMKARRKDGSLFDVSFSASTVKDKDDNPICMMVSFIDITETVQLREKLRAMSINDELTGLYNRRGFLDMAERELKIAKRKKRMLALFFADLDGMKRINDTMGHNEGDEALIDTANILKKTFREVDILARFGGDEFVILATDTSKSSAEILTVRLYENLTAHNSKETCRYNLSLSMGISCYDPESPVSLEELISQADSAMYEQKKSKKKIID